MPDSTALKQPLIRKLKPLIVGTMTRRPQSDAERIDLLQQALAMGLTSLDTAPLYDFGRIERQVGKAIEGFPREELQILSKVGLCWNDDYGDVLFKARTDQGQLTVRKD